MRSRIHRGRQFLRAALSERRAQNRDDQRSTTEPAPTLVGAGTPS